MVRIKRLFESNIESNEMGKLKKIKFFIQIISLFGSNDTRYRRKIKHLFLLNFSDLSEAHKKTICVISMQYDYNVITLRVFQELSFLCFKVHQVTIFSSI